MSKSVRFELNKSGVRELLKSAEIEGVIQEFTDQIAARAGDGYEASVINQNRAIGRVSAVTIKAKRSNAKHNTLLKCLKGT